MRFVTDLADLALLLPMAALVATCLSIVGRRREALAWLAVITATLAAILLLKSTVMALPSLGQLLGNPSGHTAAGIVVHGGLAALLLAHSRHRRLLGVAAALGCWLIFGGSRVGLGVHSLHDVLTGGAVGVLAVLALPRLAGMPGTVPRLRAVLLPAMVALAAILVFHGQRLHAERHLSAFVAELRSGLGL